MKLCLAISLSLLLIGGSTGCSVRDCDDDSGDTGDTETTSSSVSCSGAVAVRSLEIDPVVFPEPGDPSAYLPADGMRAATVTIRAERAAAGARVRVDKEPETLTIAGADDGSVVLVADRDASVATVRVSSATPGSYTLIVSADDVTASTTLKVAGPPKFVPMGPEITVRPGQVREVEVASDGGLRECWAEKAPDGLEVTLEGEDLATAPPKHSTAKTWTLTIAVDPLLTGDSVVTLRCRDHYDQESSLKVEVDG